MNDSIEIYFDDVKIDSISPSYMREEDFLFSNLTKSNYNFVIFGIPDEANTANETRKHLYNLFGNFETLKICDLGNIKKGKKESDLFFAINHVVHALAEKQIPCAIFGGNQLPTLSVFKGLKEVLRKINFVVVDSKIDIGDNTPDISEHSFLLPILKDKGLKQFDIIGCQQYYSSDEQRNFIRKNRGNSIRLAEARSHLFDLEPIFRDSDIVSIDMSAIRQCDAPGVSFPSPNGFAGEEICQMARFAGYGDKTKFLITSEVDASKDFNNQTTALSAEIIWHFIEGVSRRENEQPTEENPIYEKFIVQSEIYDDNIIFFHNKTTDRWWIEIPSKKSTEIHACKECDYQAIRNNQIPEIWLRFFLK